MFYIFSFQQLSRTHSPVPTIQLSVYPTILNREKEKKGGTECVLLHEQSFGKKLLAKMNDTFCKECLEKWVAWSKSEKKKLKWMDGDDDEGHK